ALPENLRVASAAGARTRPRDLPAGPAGGARRAGAAARGGLRARYQRRVSGPACRELCALLLSLHRRAGAHRQFGEPQLRRARCGLRSAGIARARHEEPARILQPRMKIVRDLAALRAATEAAGPLAFVQTLGNLT